MASILMIAYIYYHEKIVIVFLNLYLQFSDLFILMDLLTNLLSKDVVDFWTVDENSNPSGSEDVPQVGRFVFKLFPRWSAPHHWALIHPR